MSNENPRDIVKKMKDLQEKRLTEMPAGKRDAVLTALRRDVRSESEGAEPAAAVVAAFEQSGEMPDTVRGYQWAAKQLGVSLNQAVVVSDYYAPEEVYAASKAVATQTFSGTEGDEGVQVTIYATPYGGRWAELLTAESSFSYGAVMLRGRSPGVGLS